MEVQEIVSAARSGQYPSSWHVWPLRKQQLARAAFVWGLISIFGFFCLIFAAIAAIPDNFRAGVWIASLTVAMLTIFGVMAFGGLWLMLGETGRFWRSGEYLLVMTPDDYVKLEPRRTTHVPMDQIDSIRLKGVKLPQRAPTESEILGSITRSRVYRLMGGIGLRRQPQQQAVLSFEDQRTRQIVVVAKDNGFDDLIALEYVLRTSVEQKTRSKQFQRS